MAKFLKKDIRKITAALYNRLYYGAQGDTGLIVHTDEIPGIRIIADRSFRRGPGPAWLASYDVIDTTTNLKIGNFCGQGSLVNFIYNKINGVLTIFYSSRDAGWYKVMRANDCFIVADFRSRSEALKFIETHTQQADCK